MTSNAYAEVNLLEKTLTFEIQENSGDQCLKKFLSPLSPTEQQCLEWRAAEEARRTAVEEALEQLLARDTQYRKELSCHLEHRIELAKRRRSFHRQQYREVEMMDSLVVV